MFFSESDVSLEDKDRCSSKDKDEDYAQENSLGNDSSESDSESSSESDSDTNEVDAEEPNEDLEKTEPQLVCVESERNVQQHCEHCKILQVGFSSASPLRKCVYKQICMRELKLKLDGEGVYQCTITGLIFEVTKAAIIEYSLLSWTKYAGYIKEPWIIVGPIFDVKCTTPSVLTSIQFPHTLCLNDHLTDVTFNVFHFKNNGPEFECSVDHSATHIKWNVSSLSPVGPVIEKYDPVYYHGVVILYKVVSNLPSLEFRVYMASNNSSVIKDVSKSVKRSPNTFIKIEKPPCHKLLQGGKKYRLISEPEADITPEVTGLYQARITTSRKESVMVSIKRRKSSTSLSGDEVCNKRLKGDVVPDGVKAKTVLTDQQLMILAKKMGKDWKVIGIQCLKLSVEDIEQIEAKDEDINIYKCKMLRKWRDSEQNNGTAQSLYECLKDDATYEVLEILKGFLEQT
ncbi:hypothetical protein JD844_007508 [Phrynosoma platyrhinos]|uniref:Caspase recruitment domain-containing protein 8 n=1 Tax=Phrynosoma platyrhinos TaxID=52577 RepID=A0ABQ7T377_PHRPL|nr:hypothetical protein JD844_007508 [Phrynosoma platyrhinos]